MIATLNILAERVIRELSGGDIPDDSPYDKAFVRETVRDTLREDLKLEILQRRNGREDDRTPVTQYIATYGDVTVSFDNSSNRAYAEIPSSYMSLKHNKGVHAVSAMKTPNKRMIPIANPGVTMNLPHADLERENQGYYVEGNKIYWMRDIKRDGINKVMVKLIVPAADTWGFDDALPVVPENIARVLDIVKKRVQNLFTNDRIADGNPNLRPQNV